DPAISEQRNQEQQSKHQAAPPLLLSFSRSTKNRPTALGTTMLSSHRLRLALNTCRRSCPSSPNTYIAESSRTPRSESSDTEGTTDFRKKAVDTPLIYSTGLRRTSNKTSSNTNCSKNTE